MDEEDKGKFVSTRCGLRPHERCLNFCSVKTLEPEAIRIGEVNSFPPFLKMTYWFHSAVQVLEK